MDVRHVFERIEYIKDVPVKCFIAGVDSSYPHWHPDIEILFLLKGKLDFIMDGEQFALKPGDIVLVNSKSIHADHSDKGCLALILQFHPDVFETDYGEGAFHFHINSAAEENRRPKDMEKLQRILSMIGSEAFKQDDGFQYYVNSYFFELLGYLFRYTRYDTVNDSGKMARDGDLERIEAITRYMKQNFQYDISLADIAENLNLSVSQLCRFFKDKMGISCIDYLHHIRINHAKALLHNPHHTVLFISESCGFLSISSFYRAFRDETDMTPTEFREWIGETPKSNTPIIQGYSVINPMAGYKILSNYIGKT